MLRNEIENSKSTCNNGDMLPKLLILLAVFWLLEFVHIPLLGYGVFTMFGHVFTVLNIIVFIVVAWLINELNSPLREIASLFLVLWVISLIFSFLPDMVLLVFILALLFHFF
jgi:hypothetical protein